MLIKTVTMAGGLAGAIGLSQFPEYSQQYTQRLAGAVDELSRFVAEFDSDAAGLGLSREVALQELSQGGEIGAARAQTMQTTLERHDRLETDLEALRGAGAFTRAFQAGRFTDAEIAQAAWDDFKPAVPFTIEGLVFAGIGFIAGLGVIGGLMWLLRVLFRRRKPA